jgi:hypothetical protein
MHKMVLARRIRLVVVLVLAPLVVREVITLAGQRHIIQAAMEHQD